MTDVKRLLDEATPLPWRNGVVTGYGIYGTHHDPSALATVRHWEPSKEPMDERAKADAALIVYAVNRLPDYEAAVDALDALLRNLWRYSFEWSYDEGEVDVEEAARAALRRLREQAPA